MIIVAATPATVGTSVGVTPNNSDAISRFRPNGPRKSNHNTDAREEKSFAHHVGEHAGSIGAKRHPDTDLATPLRDDRRDDAIRADGGEEQRQAGKEPKQLRQEARPLDGVGKDGSMSRRRTTGTARSISRTTRSMVCDNAAGARVVRNTTCPSGAIPNPAGAGLAIC